MGPKGFIASRVEELSPFWRANLAWEMRKRKGDQEAIVPDSLVRRGMTVVDVAASAGDFTARFGRLVGAEGKVFSCEPLPQNLDPVEADREGRGEH